MKRKSLIFAFMAIMLVMAAGCAPGTIAQINTPIPTTQAGPPAPNGEINVPGVSIRINVPGPNPLVNTADTRGRIAGILPGIWHGIISPVTLILSFINPNIQMYEVHNNGSQYNLGFLIGVAIVFLVLGIFSGSRRH
jgi:hypothetical protein